MEKNIDGTLNLQKKKKNFKMEMPLYKKLVLFFVHIKNVQN